MLATKRWQAKTALMMALSFGVTALLPILFSQSASARSASFRVAQIFSQPSQVGLGAGTVIPVRYEEGERVVVLPEETAELTLIVAEDIRTSRGTVIIPEGSEIVGELQPSGGGSQFVAEELIFTNNNRSYPIDATSDVITDTEIITEESDPDLLRGAVIGAAAGAVLGEILGEIDFLEVLAGAGVGTLASVLLRGEEEVEVVVIDPETDLDLTLESDFILR